MGIGWSVRGGAGRPTGRMKVPEARALGPPESGGRAGQWGTRGVTEGVSGAKQMVVDKSGLGVQEETICRFPRRWLEPISRSTGGIGHVGAVVLRSTRRRADGGGHVVLVGGGERSAGIKAVEEAVAAHGDGQAVAAHFVYGSAESLAKPEKPYGVREVPAAAPQPVGQGPQGWPV